MSKIVIPLPSTDFDPTEAAVPWKILSQNGVEVCFATSDGGVASADARMLNGNGLGIWSSILKADANAVMAYDEMIQDPRFRSPILWNAIDVARFDGILLPGGHAPGMKPYLESEVLQKAVHVFFQQSKLVGAICHGMVLAARSRRSDGSSVLKGFRATALLGSQELTAWAMTGLWLGNYYRTYPETVQAEVTRALDESGQFVSGPMPLQRDSLDRLERGFVVEDRNLISARWPGDAHRFASTYLHRLKN